MTFGQVFFDMLVNYLTADFPGSAENQYFWMALQGCMTCRNGRNKDKTMHWFHAFSFSLVCGYGGSLLAPLWMGNPTSILRNDMGVACVAIAFLFVNYLPFDLGMKVGNLYPVVIVTVLFSQLFRTVGVVGYADIAYEAFKDNPSDYYPTPIFGPILFATILGNMSSFFIKGFDGYLQHGMPWPFQNGFFCATFYHFVAHDEKGFIGIYLRKLIHSVPQIMMGLDDRTFAIVVVSAFMQICGLLQMPHHLGPGFSPFVAIPNLCVTIFQRICLVFYPTVPKDKRHGDAKVNKAYLDSVQAAESNGPITDLTKKKQ